MILSLPKTAVALLLAVFMVMHINSCENSFEPMQENDRYAFSMYGALDLHADTQWVRVMPVGSTLIPRNREDGDVKVTLTRESTGETFAMKDSVFVFGNDARVTNYWTDRKLVARERYTLHARSPSAGHSSVSVTMPSKLSLPLVKLSVRSGKVTVTGMSADPVVMADSKFWLRKKTAVGLGAEIELTVSHMEDIYVAPNGEYRISLNIPELIEDELNVGTDDYVLYRKELNIASAGKDWPDLSGLTEQEIMLPGVVSNVQHGTGYVVGIALRNVPLKNCFDGEGDHTTCEQVN